MLVIPQCSTCCMVDWQLCSCICSSEHQHEWDIWNVCETLAFTFKFSLTQELRDHNGLICVGRFPAADFLLSGGQSMTWLLGNKLITVTTSGCSMKALKNGLCDKCWLLCRADKGENMQIGTISSAFQMR